MKLKKRPLPTRWELTLTESRALHSETAKSHPPVWQFWTTPLLRLAVVTSLYKSCRLSGRCRTTIKLLSSLLKT
jgi:hypothetical protein